MRVAIGEVLNPEEWNVGSGWAGIREGIHDEFGSMAYILGDLRSISRMDFDEN